MGLKNIMELKDFIVPTILENTDENYDYGNSAFETKDLIYLPSRKDVEHKSNKDLISTATDYAIMNGCLMQENENEEIFCYSLWTRTAPAVDRVITITTCNGNLYTSHITTHGIGIRPELQLDLLSVISAINSSQTPFKIDETTPIRGLNYHTLQFGNYPKTCVDGELNKQLEYEFLTSNITPTGKKYLGNYDDKGNPVYNDEFVAYNRQKYVRVICQRQDSDSVLRDGTEVEDELPLWAKVEPITWIITNWDDLPTSINPIGTGTATTIKLQAEEAIMSDIPFYPNDEDVNRCLWQNSTIRGYLNGINVNNIKTNGNPNFSAPNGGDFTEHNFLTEAFSQELQPTSKKDEVVSHIKKKRKGYGISIKDKPMTVKDQMKFYIDSGKTFMLHGPSGIGKTRRIQEIDPDFIPIALKKGMTPESVIGKTTYSTNDDVDSGKWKAPAWYKVLCEKCEKEPDKKHVVFIDEITNAGYAEQSLVFDIIQFGYITPAFGKLPDNAVVVAAGNNIDESDSAYPMVEPLFRRFDGHIYLEPNLKEWLEWASEENPERVGTPKVHPLVSAFVSANANKVFYSSYDSEEPPKHAIDPRGWEQISDIIYDNDGVIAKELIENKVGKEIASSFMAFAENPPLMIEDILDGNYSQEDIPIRFDAKYALALSLRNADMEELPVVREFISKHLGNEILATYDTIWIGDDNERAIYLDGLIRSTLYEDLDDEPEPEVEIERPITGNFKITIDDFFDYSKCPKSKVGIHCDEEWKADILCAVFDRMGKKWSDGDSYLETPNWDKFNAETCYNNQGQFGDASTFNRRNYPIYKFEEVDLTKYVTKEEEKVLVDKGMQQYLPF